MKKVLIIVILLLSSTLTAQNVDILDKNRKVLKTVSEKHLQRTVDSIGTKARYTARWIDKKPVECRIQRIENILI